MNTGDAVNTVNSVSTVVSEDTTETLGGLSTSNEDKDML